MSASAINSVDNKLIVSRLTISVYSLAIESLLFVCCVCPFADPSAVYLMDNLSVMMLMTMMAVVSTF